MALEMSSKEIDNKQSPDPFSPKKLPKTNKKSARSCAIKKGHEKILDQILINLVTRNSTKAEIDALSTLVKICTDLNAVNAYNAFRQAKMKEGPTVKKDYEDFSKKVSGDQKLRSLIFSYFQLDFLVEDPENAGKFITKDELKDIIVSEAKKKNLYSDNFFIFAEAYYDENRKSETPSPRDNNSLFSQEFEKFFFRPVPVKKEIK